MFDGIDLNDVANLAAGAQRQRQEALLREQNEKLDAIRVWSGQSAAKGLFLDRQTRLAQQCGGHDQQEQLRQRERAIHRAVPDRSGQGNPVSQAGAK